VLSKNYILLFSVLFLLGCGGGSSNKTPSSEPLPKGKVGNNHAPVAKITVGQNQTFYVGEEFLFTGIDSTDANNDKLIYKWSLFNNDSQAIAIDNPTAKDLNLVFKGEGEHLIRLVVNDGKVDSEAVEYLFTVAKQRVLANAGPDQSSKIGKLITLTAKSSYVLNGVINYQWRFIKKPESSTVQLHNVNSVESEFIADIIGMYRLGLIVSNDSGQQSYDEVEVEVKRHVENSSPNAIITLVNDQVLVSKTLKLSARESRDVDGDHLTYLWEIISQPSNSNTELNNYSSIEAEFIANAIGDYEVELVVSDPDKANSRTTAKIKVVEGNQAPIANAGKDQLISTGQNVQLSGSASYDPEQDLITYQWSLIKKPNNSSVELITLNQKAVNIKLDVDGDYIFSLIVSDGSLDSKPSQVRVTAKTNQKPVAKIKPVAVTYLHKKVSLDATESYDAEGADLQYKWQWLSRASNSELNDATSNSPSFTPLASGKYVLQLIVNDGIQDSDPVELSITAQQNLPPIVSIAGDSERSATIYSNVTLDASLTTDPEGGQLTYVWTLQTPSLSNAALTYTNRAITSFTPNTRGTYTATLNVTDDSGNSEKKQIVIVVFLVDVEWVGTVNGRLIDSLGRGVENLNMYASSGDRTGLDFSTDANGYYQARVGLSAEKKFNVSVINNTNMGWGDVVRNYEVTTNNFTIDLGTKTALLNQNVTIGLTACTGYSGPNTLKLDFSTPNNSLFIGDLEQTVNKKQSITLDEIKTFPLASSVLYRVKIDNSKLVWIKDKATGAYQTNIQWQLALQANSSNIVSENFEVCDKKNP
jgi:hypothetical protein